MEGTAFHERRWAAVETFQLQVGSEAARKLDHGMSAENMIRV